MAKTEKGSRPPCGSTLIIAAMAALVSACTLSPGQPPADGDVLYAANCAGCHGADGKGGAARGLADPVFLRIADDDTLRRITAHGVSGTAMPAFAKADGGGLSDAQIDMIVHGMRSHRRPSERAGR